MNLSLLVFDLLWSPLMVMQEPMLRAWRTVVSTLFKLPCRPIPTDAMARIWRISRRARALDHSHVLVREEASLVALACSWAGQVHHGDSRSPGGDKGQAFVQPELQIKIGAGV